MDDQVKAKWLGEGYPPAQGTKKWPPFRHFLVDLNVLEKDGEEAKLFRGTPPSLQVITAGGTAMAKWWTGLAAAGFGGSALVQGLKALNWLPGADVEGLQQAVLTGSAAFVAAAAAIAIAVIVRADVSGRAVASAAEYQARAAIATALIQSFQYESGPPVAAPEPKHVIRTRRGEWEAVRQFEWLDGRMVGRVSATKTIPVREISWITPSGVWSG